MRCFNIIIGALFAGVFAFGQQYAFLPIAGSPKGAVHLFQDSEGRLWIGGHDLTCFDGSRFYSLREYGLPPTEILDIAQDRSGAIWIGASTGVFRFSGGKVAEISKGAAFNVIPIAPDTVVAAMGPLGRTVPDNDTKLIRIQGSGSQWKTEAIMDLDSPSPLTLDRQGSISYFWHSHGWNEIRVADVLRWRSGTELPVERHLTPGAPVGGTFKVIRDRDGCIWLTTNDGGGGAVSRCGSVSHLAVPTGVGNLREADDGTLLLWGFSVLALGNKQVLQVAGPINGLPGLSDAILASDGTIWLASSSGLYRFASPFRLEYWTARENLRPAPWSVTKSAGRIYVGVDEAIMTLGRDRTQWEMLASFGRYEKLTSLLASADGSVLASLIGGGVVQVNPQGKILARTKYSLRATMRLLRTPDGEIWLGGSSLGRLTRRGNVLQYADHPLATQPAKNLLAVKYEPQTNKLWACYDGGAVVRDANGQWREITKRDGLLANDCWSLAPLPNGDVWYAYRGVSSIALLRQRADGGFTVRQYSSRDGVPDLGNDTFDVDQRGRLWRAGEAVNVADPAQAEAGEWLRLDQSDGFPVGGMNSGSYFADPDGSLWWGADNDLVHYTPPNDLVRPASAPKVFLSAFSSNGGAPKLAEAIDDFPHATTVTAHIGSLQFDRRNALRLRYRLLPEQTSWRETRNLDLPLGVVSSGRHTLEVQGRIFTGPWSKTVTHSFRVLPSIWLSGRFLFTYLLAGAILLTTLVLLRRKRQWEEQALLPDLGEWRLGALVHDGSEFAGSVLDSRFEIGDLLARGGFASVMAGFDRRYQRRCAIKIFRGELKAPVVRGFEQEVAALRQIQHPNVVSIYADGLTPSGVPYLAMEFVAGKNLREVLQDGALPRTRAARFLEQLANALDAIHERGICHRDVKPENVIIRDTGQPAEEAVLIDFSIAIIKDANETLHGLSRAAGTFDYMAPEQAMGHAQPASDIFSLAKLAIEMLTGQRVSALLPNAALDLPARIPEALSRFPLGLTPGAIDMLSRALEFDPSKRPSVASVFAGPIVSDLIISNESR